MTGTHPRVDLAGLVVDLMDEEEAVLAITARAAQPAALDRHAWDTGIEPPLAVIPAALDHIVQFGTEGPWRHTLGNSLRPTRADVHGEPRRLDWLTLLAGAPLVVRSSRLTGRDWPRLAGTDLVGPLLDAAEEAGIAVGFLGGSYVVQRLLSRRLVRTRPGLVVAGMWSPERSELADEEASLRLAESIADAGVQLLIVGLDRPRQELWIARYGPATGANVLLAFGAVADVLADVVRRAPRVVSDHGLEWAWRLAREPRRLARRYLLDDPPGLLQLRRDSAVISAPDEDAPPPAPAGTASRPVTPPAGVTGTPAMPGAVTASGAGAVEGTATARGTGAFVSLGHGADVAVLAVTHDNEDDVQRFVASLRREAAGLRLRVVVADNDSTDRTLALLRAEPDVTVVATGGDLGYAAGLNAARRYSGEADAVLVLDPGVEVQPGSIGRLLAQIRSGRADIAVPRLVDAEGRTLPSLRREPSVARVFGDALLGPLWAQRPPALAETDTAPESYQFGHEADWASGAAMVRADLARRLGDWDERFFLYSEDTDYFRRARALGAVVWYEPTAVMTHGGGTGNSTRPDALMAVSRVRYLRKYHPEPVVALYRAGVVLHELLRLHRPERRGILGIVSDEARWETLPGPLPARQPATVLAGFPRGAVIIPAQDEADVILRTLTALDPVLRTGRVEVIVVCHGCTDHTAALAASVPGVQVLESPLPSRTAALNAGDALATQWPRVYLDADVAITPTTLRRVLERLHAPVQAARPDYRYDDDGATWPVQAYYRARRRLPSADRSLGGAGVFGLTEEGHARFGVFPDVTAHDVFVDQAFAPDEKVIVPAPPVWVRTPSDGRSLVRVLRRDLRGPADRRGGRVDRAGRDGHVGETRTSAVAWGPVDVPGTPAGTTSTKGATGAAFWELVRSVRGPWSAVDALSYSSLAAAPRIGRTLRRASGPGTSPGAVADGAQASTRSARKRVVG